MSELHWTTQITQVQPNEIRLRGYRVDALMGKIGFAQAIYLALKGELPDEAQTRLIEAIFVSSIDHGASPPSTLAARTAASTGAPLNAAVAAGILSINRHHGGAIEDCMRLLLEGRERLRAPSATPQIVAESLVAEYRAERRRIPGLGHRLHTDDPRTAKLFSMARQAGLTGEGVALMEAIQQAMAQAGKALPINVDGAIAALLVDLGFPPELANAFFFMARTPGLVAHAYEEMTQQRPMRRIHPTDHAYAGPAPRELDR